jgi:hypothetical protein
MMGLDEVLHSGQRLMGEQRRRLVIAQHRSKVRQCDVLYRSHVFFDTQKCYSRKSGYISALLDYVWLVSHDNTYP